MENLKFKNLGTREKKRDDGTSLPLLTALSTSA